MWRVGRRDPLQGIDAQPPRSVGPRGNLPLAGLLLLLLVLALVSYVAYPLPSEIRWFVLALVLVGVAYIALRALYRGTVRVPPLDPPEQRGAGSSGELSRLAKIVERADRGLPYSQGLVALRAREAFLARIRSETGMESEELAVFLTDPSRLRHLVRDPVLREFLEDTAAGEDLLLDRDVLREGPLRSEGGSSGFSARIHRVLRAMEDWP